MLEQRESNSLVLALVRALTHWECSVLWHGMLLSENLNNDEIISRTYFMIYFVKLSIRADTDILFF